MFQFLNNICVSKKLFEIFIIIIVVVVISLIFIIKKYDFSYLFEIYSRESSSQMFI